MILYFLWAISQCGLSKFLFYFTPELEVHNFATTRMEKQQEILRVPQSNSVE